MSFLLVPSVFEEERIAEEVYAGNREGESMLVLGFMCLRVVVLTQILLSIVPSLILWGVC